MENDQQQERNMQESKILNSVTKSSHSISSQQNQQNSSKTQKSQEKLTQSASKDINQETHSDVSESDGHYEISPEMLLCENQSMKQEIQILKAQLQAATKHHKGELNNLRTDTHKHLSYMADLMKQLQESGNLRLHIMHSQMRDQRIYYENLINKVTNKMDSFIQQCSERKQNFLIQSSSKLDTESNDNEVQRLKDQIRELKSQADIANKQISNLMQERNMFRDKCIQWCHAVEHQQTKPQEGHQQSKNGQQQYKDLSPNEIMDTQSLMQLSQGNSMYDSGSQRGSSPITSPYLSVSRIKKNIEQSKKISQQRENEIKSLQKSNIQPYQDRVKDNIAAAEFSKNSEQYKQQYFTQQLMQVEKQDKQM